MPAEVAHGGGEPPVRVLLVDDQELIRAGFAMILGVEDDLEVVGQAGDGLEAVAKVVELRPDVVLMDVSMPVLDGIEATRRIVAETDALVVVLTTFDSDEHLVDALRAGASGFLLKNNEPEELVAAIRAVARGHALLAPAVTRRVIEGFARQAPPARPGAPSPASAPPPSPSAVDDLTDRERDVLLRMARGLSNAEIAADLVLGEATIKTHVSRVLMKLGVRDRVQAVIAAYEAGLATTGGTTPT